MKRDPLYLSYIAYPADSVFDTNNLLSHEFCPSLCRYGLVINTEDRE